ncbi:hypothetical protein GCM10009530_76610 [Microbispora corallina]|uniref:Uncharacterized protein n=1 Tax=Microbispora corallina TaxID=83302 RepID=A0ABQ4GC30_9ACTN|nr:hypothetical protein [Microbispora corallina]GIH44580.1 hypothetical protein Mco01_75800 [Microbispora corallina]
MRNALIRRAVLSGGVAALTLTALPSVTASADPAPMVEVFTDDPYANVTAPDYKLSYALKEAEARALAKPDQYAQPYVQSGAVYIPVTSQDVVSEASQPLSLPPQLTPPDDGSGDPANVPDPVDKDAVPVTEPTAAATQTASAQQKQAAALAEATAGGTAKTTTQSAQSASPGVTNPWIVYPKVRVVAHSITQLNAFKDEVLTLGTDVLPGGDKLLTSTIQPERDRVILESTLASDELRTALAARYGADAMAIRLVSDPGEVQPSSGRWDDGHVGGFYGGAHIDTSVGGCTDGFSWYSGSTKYMLTAGHCTTLGGSVWTSAEYLGSVVEDTFANGSGTVYINGQSTYHGDLSLIKITGSYYGAPRIYVGGKTSKTSRPVSAMWSRRADYGDQYCTGGAMAGELCGWRVNALRINFKWSDGRITKNMIRGIKQGQCIIKGDSGGPVYTVTSAGNVVAKGIQSGKGGGGSDNWGGAFDPCIDTFTDVWEAYYGFPGFLSTT